jgi:hypothetical protein
MINKISLFSLALMVVTPIMAKSFIPKNVYVGGGFSMHSDKYKFNASGQESSFDGTGQLENFSSTLTPSNTFPSIHAVVGYAKEKAEGSRYRFFLEADVEFCIAGLKGNQFSDHPATVNVKAKKNFGMGLLPGIHIGKNKLALMIAARVGFSQYAYDIYRPNGNTIPSLNRSQSNAIYFEYAPVVIGLSYQLSEKVMLRGTFEWRMSSSKKVVDNLYLAPNQLARGLSCSLTMTPTAPVLKVDAVYHF